MKKVNRGTIIDMVWYKNFSVNPEEPNEVPGADEEETSLQKFLEPTKKTQVIYTDNSLVFGKACENPSWNHCTSTPHRYQTQMGLPKEQCAE